VRTVRLYSKEDCHLCDDARMILDAVATRMPFQVQVVDIEQDPVLRKLFGEHIPVVDFGDGTRLYWPFMPEDVLQALNGTLELPQGTVVDKEAQRPAVSGRTRDLVVFVDKQIYHLARHWILVIGFFMGLYAGLPFLAPILMASGYSGPANLIYSAYRFACHQLPSRSYFIFGQQVAYCHRDTAIYTTLFVAILLFALVRHRIKPLPWQGYVAFITPMAIDGITQLFGLRTSNWQLRTITGALFGLGSAWLALPYLEEAFQDIRQSVEDNLRLEKTANS
jgi:uncharacterized membrane protein